MHEADLQGQVKRDWITEVTGNKSVLPRRWGRPPDDEHVEIDPTNSKESPGAARTSLLRTFDYKSEFVQYRNSMSSVSARSSTL